MTQYSGKVIRKNPVTPTQASASGVWKPNEVAVAVRNNTWPVAGVPDPISRSARLRSSASAYFNRTQTAGSQTTWTFSGWVKVGALSGTQYLMQAGGSSGSGIAYNVGTNDFQVEIGNGTTQYYARAAAAFRDPSAWYHVVAVADTNNATSTDRLRLYVNGVRQTIGASSFPTSGFTGYMNQNTVAANIGRWNGGTPGQYFDGYLTEINFIDGQALTPSSFGTTDQLTGAWVPMAYTGTYGTNGFYLNFKNNTSTTTLGYDYSGNGNNWTANNISLTAGSTYDSMLDVPTPWIGYNTDGGVSVTRGNYCTLNPVNCSPGIVGYVTNGNLQVSNAGVGATWSGGIGGSVAVSSGKWYYECTTSGVNSASSSAIGWASSSIPMTTDQTNYFSQTAGLYIRNDVAVNKQQYLGFGSNGVLSTSAFVDATVQLVIDIDAGKGWIGVNGTYFGSGNPSTGANPTFTFTPSGSYYPYLLDARGDVGTILMTANFGQRPFTYTPPTGFKSLCTTNLPDPTIKLGAQYMAASTYTGNGYPTSGTQSITNGGNNTTGTTFQPDFIWIKRRDTAASHTLTDSVRGVNSQLFSNQTAAQETNTDDVTAFNANGFSLGAGASGTYPSVNNNSGTYVGWQWKANGSAVSNTSGSITSQVNAGTTQGFSIVTYTGTGVAATVGHGLGVAPSMIIVKRRDATGGGSTAWGVYHKSLGATKAIWLNETSAAGTNTAWNNTEPTSSVFSVGTTSEENGSGTNIVAYCWAEIAGFSKFGSYTGNGSADGPFVYCGFRPRWVMWKKTTGVAADWDIVDTARDDFNVCDNPLYPNSSSAETTVTKIDITSNGFKVRGTSTDTNVSGETYIFAAFAENPFKYSNAR